MAMALRTFLARTLVALALVGLFSAPLIAPTPASAAPAAMSMAEMADDMPCCPPDTSPMRDCFKGCPLLTVCVAKCFQNAPSVGSPLPFPGGLATVILPANDAVPAAMAQSPPARPPRSLS